MVSDSDESQDRYEIASELIRSLLDASSSVDYGLSASFTADIELLFKSKATSYRELVFTITLARILDPSYQATIAFYACSPRPLYEKSIRPELLRKKISCGQSPALNIAKATNAIDRAWVSQRRPADVAEATLRLVTGIDVATEETLAVIAKIFATKFLELAKTIANSEFAGDPSLTLEQVSKVLNGLIKMAPDSGNTAQRIVGLLLGNIYQHPDIRVEGTHDSAFQTNATSKKIGDLSLVTASGEILLVVEVTTKPFDAQRISECSQSLDIYAAESTTKVESVLVLCRKEDCPAGLEKALESSEGFLGRLRDSSYEYEFVDLYAWIDSTIAIMPRWIRQQLMNQLVLYVNHFQTSARVKEVFASLVAARRNQSAH